MSNIRIGWTVLGIVLILGCAGRTTTKTTPEGSVEHHHGPESPKAKGDDLEREFHGE
jgi:hypothetical protein